MTKNKIKKEEKIDMAINAEVLTSFNKIDEAYIDGLLKKEIEANNKKIVVLDLSLIHI